MPDKITPRTPLNSTQFWDYSPFCFWGHCEWHRLTYKYPRHGEFIPHSLVGASSEGITTLSGVFNINESKFLSRRTTVACFETKREHCHSSFTRDSAFKPASFPDLQKPSGLPHSRRRQPRIRIHHEPNAKHYSRPSRNFARLHRGQIPKAR